MADELNRWRPFGDLTTLRDEMDRLWGRFIRDWPAPIRREGAGQWLPTVDVSETPKEVVVEAEIPGMDPKDIDISLQGSKLTLRGQRKQEKKEEGKNYHRVERTYGTFSRTIQLPAEVDASKVNATYKNGVLRVNMPKSKEETVKKIEVKSS
jgi:HSP20 family protein